MNWVAESVVLLIPVVASVAFFAFLAVGVWADARRRERESYYRYEFRKRLVEAGKLDADDVKELVQFEADARAAAGRRALLVGGVLFASVGVGLVFGLRFLDGDPVWMVGYIPLSIGVGMLALGALSPARSAGPRLVRREGGQG